MSGGDAPGRPNPVFGYLDAVIALLKEPGEDKLQDAVNAGVNAYLGDEAGIRKEGAALVAGDEATWARFFGSINEPKYRDELEDLYELSPFNGQLLFFRNEYGRVEVLPGSADQVLTDSGLDESEVRVRGSYLVAVLPEQVTRYVLKNPEYDYTGNTDPQEPAIPF